MPRVCAAKVQPAVIKARAAEEKILKHYLHDVESTRFDREKSL
jgi:hypothetical protein